MSSVGRSDAALLRPTNGQTLVLLSGGIDSSATLALYRQRPTAVSALFVEYGQDASEPERHAAQQVSAHYNVSLSIVRCEGLGPFHEGYVPGRNALLFQVAFAAAHFEVGQIAMGLHAGSPYADCGPAFVAEMQRIFDLYCDGKVRAVAPFIEQDKPGILAFCREAEVPVALTYSCERGSVPACGACLSCLDRTALDVG